MAITTNHSSALY